MKAAVANFRPTGENLVGMEQVLRSYEVFVTSENLVGMEQVLRSYEVSEKPLRRYAIPTPFPTES